MNQKHLTLFCAGLGAGAALAVLFAPKSGEETRGQIRASLEDGKRKLNEKQSALRDSARGVVDNVNSAINAGREAYRSTTGQLKKEFEHAASSVG